MLWFFTSPEMMQSLTCVGARSCSSHTVRFSLGHCWNVEVQACSGERSSSRTWFLTGARWRVHSIGMGSGEEVRGRGGDGVGREGKEGGTSVSNRNA